MIIRRLGMTTITGIRMSTWSMLVRYPEENTPLGWV